MATPRASLEDIHAPGTLKVRLGDSFKNVSASESLALLQYNYLPPNTDQDGASTTITREGPGGPIVLNMRGTEGDYVYTGIEAEDELTLVLIADGHNDHLTIDTVHSAWAFNLCQTPLEDDGNRLAKRHPHMPALDGRLPEGGTADSPVDDGQELETDNPFDWRHYFTPGTPNVDAATSSVSSVPSPAYTNTPASRQGTPSVRPVKKPVNPMLSNQRRPRKAQAPMPRDQGPAVATVPQVHVSGSTNGGAKPRPRRQRADEDIIMDDYETPKDTGSGDDNDLVLDEIPHPRSFNSARQNLEVSSSQGPISLRSAASSPGSHVGSPGLPPPRSAAAANDADLMVDDGEDNDVEDLRIPSPARKPTGMALPTIVTSSVTTHRASMQTPISARRKSNVHNATLAGTVDLEDDDDLEAGLMEAMMADEDDAGAAGSGVADEEEESEEE